MLICPYTVKTEHEGTFRESSVRVVHYETGSRMESSHLLADRFTHENLLRIHFINEELEHTIFDGLGVSLSAYCYKKLPYTEVRYPATHATADPDVRYLSDEYRKIILGGINVIQLFHKNNVKVGYFDKGNIVVDAAGNPKFFNLGDLEEEDSPLSDSDKITDYYNIFDLVRDILPSHVPVPADVQHFLDMISPQKNWNSFVKDFGRFENLLKNHVVLKTAIEADFFYRKMGEATKHLDANDTLRKYLKAAVLKCPSLKLKSRWADVIKQWTLFYDVYAFKASNYWPNHKSCWWDDLLRFIRNCLVHLKDDHWTRWVKSDEITKWIDKFFPRFMAELQCGLADVNMLDGLMAA